MFKTYYHRRFEEIFETALKPSDGIANDAVLAKLKKRDLKIPKALTEYYVFAGKHRINKDRNRLRRIDELEWLDDKLIFMGENQIVGFWGIDKSDINKSNPMVWQGQNTAPRVWHKEEYRLSQFLMAMWKWTITGEQEKPESS